MQTLKIWIENAIGHPVTTLAGAMPTIFAVTQWIAANRGASKFEVVWAVTSLILGAAMTDPKAKTSA